MTVLELLIEAMLPDDWEAVSQIYADGIATGNATFETNTPAWEGWNQSHLESCRLVAKHNDKVVGWAALSPVSSRCVYGGVAEVSVYVSPQVWGQGIGKALLKALIHASEDADIWTLQAGILKENSASIRLHEACGFRQVGYRERLGQLDGIWRDVVLMERRSSKVGI